MIVRLAEVIARIFYESASLTNLKKVVPQPWARTWAIALTDTVICRIVSGAVKKIASSGVCTDTV